MISLGIAQEPEVSKIKPPWLWVYYSGSVDPARTEVIRKVVYPFGRLTGEGFNYRKRESDISFAFTTPFRASSAGDLLMRLKLISRYKVTN